MNRGQATDPETFRIDKDRCPGSPSLIVAKTSCDWWPHLESRRPNKLTKPALGTVSRKVYDLIAASNGIRGSEIARKLGLTLEQVRGQIKTMEKRYDCIQGHGKMGNSGYIWKAK